MVARYYSSGLARFMAVDPAARSIHPMNPQTWNRYSYVLNNPLIFVDPTGEDLVLKGKETALQKTQDTANANMHGKDLKVDEKGNATLVDTGQQGPASPEQANFENALSQVIGNAGTTEIKVVESTSSTAIGNLSKGTVDIDDVNAFGGGNPASSGAVLGHEIVEQFASQVKGVSDYSAHVAGISAENFISGWTRGGDPTMAAGPGGVNGTASIPYTRGGASTTVNVTFKGGNVVDVTKK
jgi:hypothetical protein